MAAGDTQVDIWELMFNGSVDYRNFCGNGAQWLECRASQWVCLSSSVIPGVPRVSHPPDFNFSDRSSAHLPVPAGGGAVSRDPLRPLGPGEHLADRYELRRELQPGVFVALDRVGSREVRLVIVTGELVPLIQRIVNSTASIGLIPIFDVHMTARASFYTAELVDGMTLRQDLAGRVASEQRFTVEEVRRIGEQLIDSLRSLAASNLPFQINLETVIVTSDGRVRLSETTLFASGKSDIFGGQHEVAAVLYELSTGIRPVPGCRSADLVRGQIPRPFGLAIQRAMDSQRGRQYRSLNVFQRSLQLQKAARSRLESLLMGFLFVFALIAVGLGWWLTRPPKPRFTKADYAQRLGQVQELQQRAAQIDSGLISEAKVARDDLDKWQRELNAAREGNKPAQQEYATQRLAEIRPSAEIHVQIGALWQRQQQKTVWQSKASGELTAAQSLAGEGQFDGAIEHLTEAEALYSKPIHWKQAADRVLSQARSLQNELQQRRANSVAAVPFAYEWPTQALAGLLEVLTSTDGQGAIEIVAKVEAALPLIENLVLLRSDTVKAEQETEVLNDVQEIRQQRQEQLTRFRQADDQLRLGEFDAARAGYEQSAERLLQLPVTTIELLLATARTSRSAGKIDAALTLLANALSLPAPSTAGPAIQAEAYLLRAEIRDDQRNPRAAIDDCNQALALQPQNLTALLLRAKLFLVKSEPDRAIADCNAALQTEPGSELAYNYRAMSQALQGKITEALSDFDAALRINPRSLNALVQRGLIRLDRREYPLAAEDFQAVLTQAPQQPLALAGRANLLRIQGDFTGAIRDAEELLRVRPDSADGYLLRGAARLGLGSLDAATSDLQRAMELNPRDTAAMVFLAQAFNRTGSWKRALALCESALKRDARCVDALAERGKAYTIGGEINAAQTAFDQALKIDPDHTISLAARADILVQKNQLSEAMQDFDRVLSQIPNHVAARIGRATLWIVRANYLRATEDCDAALQADPKAMMAFRTRALANSKLGKHEQTISDCTAALQLDGTVAEVYAYRGAAWLEQGEVAKAIEDCDAALQRNPNLGWCYRTRGKAWFKQGDQERANADYQTALRLETK